MKITVRLGREAGVDGLAGETAARREIGFDKGFDKVFGIIHSVISTPLNIAEVLYTIRFLFTISKKKYIMRLEMTESEV